MHIPGADAGDLVVDGLQPGKQLLGAEVAQGIDPAGFALESRQMQGHGGGGLVVVGVGVCRVRRKVAGDFISAQPASMCLGEALSGQGLKAGGIISNMSITYKDAAGIEGMRVAGKLASELLDYLTPFVKPGITTNEIDRLAHVYMTEVQHTIPATLGYQPSGYGAYPKSLCTSVNHQVCHGIPNDKPLKKGDIVNIDVTVIKDTWHGDSSRMFLVGETSIAAKRLCQITYDAMWQGIMRVKPGIRLGDIGHAIQTFAEKQGFSIVREFCGHGIGQRFHEDPQVLHYGRPGTLDVLKPGMTFTIEPMINIGKRDIKDGPEKDGWSIVTRDHSLSAQWEHTILVTETGYEVLTLSAGTPATPDFVAAFHAAESTAASVPVSA